jgi:hypothetical protein
MGKHKTTPRRVAKTRSTGKAKADSQPSITEDTIFQHLKLLHVRLLNLQANVAIQGGKTPDKAQIESGANLGIGTDGKNLHVNSVINILGRPDLESTDGSELQIHIEYQVVYQMLDIEPNEVLKFPQPLVRAGMLVIWPNFRETVLSITAKMGIPPLVLPMFVSGAGGMAIGGTEIKYIKTDGPPNLLSRKKATSKDRLAKANTPTQKKRIQGYH